MADQWDSFYRAFAPGGTLANGTPAFAGVYNDPIATGQGPTHRSVTTVPINPATGMPYPQQTAVQAIDTVVPSTDVAKSYNDRLPASEPLAYTGGVAANPNPFSLPPFHGGWPMLTQPVQVAQTAPAAPAPAPQGLAGFFGNVLSGSAPHVPAAPAVAPVVAAHAPTNPLSALAQMFLPSATPAAPPSPELQRVRDIVSGRAGNTYASAGNYNASAAAQMSPGGSLSTTF